MARATCPLCGKRVKVTDPYEGRDEKLASAWLATHRDWRTNKKCRGSLMATEREAILRGKPA